VLNEFSTPWRRMGEWMYRSDLGTSWRWVVSFTPLPRYPRGKSPRFPLDGRLGGPQSRSGRCWEEKILDPTGTRTPDPLSRPACSQSLYRLRYPGSLDSVLFCSKCCCILYHDFSILRLVMKRNMYWDLTVRPLNTLVCCLLLILKRKSRAA
jgi:hypothetical protein